MSKTIKSTALATAILAGLATGAANAAGGGAHMTTTGRTSQPIGHHLYCKQYPRDCNLRSTKTAPLALTRDRWNDLVEINNHANSTVAPVTDLEFYKVEEHWTYPNQYGDCEDFALLKRHLLMKRGWPASSLLITVVRQPNGDGHAVLTVRTDRADYILDNLNGKIRPWNKTEYRYLKRQAVKNSGHWTTIDDNRNQIVGSVN